MKYQITHKTIYNYIAPVVQSHHILHLSPRTVPHQNIISHTLIIDPAPASRIDFIDYNQNPTANVTIEQDHSTLQFHAQSQIEIISTPPKITTSPAWEAIANTAAALGDLEILPYTCWSRLTPPSKEILDYCYQSFAPGRPIHEAALDLTARIFKEFTFDNAATDISTPISEVLKMKRGVCQDFAHLQIACMRALRLPTRYVSGYLLTRPPEGMPKLAGTDASHAWISLWCGESLGWVDFDPTNNMIPYNEHITFAYGMDYDDVSPISGVLIGGGNQQVTVAVDVIPLQ